MKKIVVLGVLLFLAVLPIWAAISNVQSSAFVNGGAVDVRASWSDTEGNEDTFTIYSSRGVILFQNTTAGLLGMYNEQWDGKKSLNPATFEICDPSNNCVEEPLVFQ
jgi:hypothetical protein